MKKGKGSKQTLGNNVSTIFFTILAAGIALIGALVIFFSVIEALSGLGLIGGIIGSVIGIAIIGLSGFILYESYS